MAQCLLYLPRELRDMIWTYALADATLDTKASGFITRKSSLLAVCRQVRIECTPIYFKHVAIAPRDWHVCTAWFINLPSDCRTQVDIARKKLHAQDYHGIVRTAEGARQLIVERCAEFLKKRGVPFQWLVLKLVLESPGIRMRLKPLERPEYICQWRWNDGKVRLLARSDMMLS